ncbi:MAG: hypothetical protein KC944_24510 [Candidatus Omnitrophica bacterium]|nr:hypothetical protein [Candidatus Omnitrophota bacterium]
MSLTSNKGAILEEVVLFLLKKLGYRNLTENDEGARLGKAGLEIEGRGEWHQIDAAVSFDHTPPFVYPLRLLVEAKCYDLKRPIGIDVVRNSVGVLKDISENYFSASTGTGGARYVKAPRFNYVSAVFSTSGYTDNAQRFAVAHQIFLIQYLNNPLFEPIADGIREMAESDFKRGFLDGDLATSRVRKYVRRKLENPHASIATPYTQKGARKFRRQVLQPLETIEGSYFGMLQGRWPIHFLSRAPLHESVFSNQDVVLCRIYGKDSDRWSFVPLDGTPMDADWFRLEFALPTEIARLVKETGGDRVQTANLKREHFSFVTLSGIIGGVRRQVRLELDEPWIEDYIRRFG